MGWSGEHGIRRGRRSAGTEEFEVGGVAEYIKSSDSAPLKSPLR